MLEKPCVTKISSNGSQCLRIYKNISKPTKTNSVCVVHERSHSGETLKQWQPWLRVYKKISKATQTVQYVLSVRGHSGDTWKYGSGFSN